MDDLTLWQQIQNLSLREKASLCSGFDFWTTKEIPEKNIPSLRMADGPHGLRYEDRTQVKKEGGNSRRATCFPTEVALACSFSPELTQKVGEAIAEECLHYGVGMILGPGVNIKRSPLGGRNFEYYSEDPLLAGELAAGFISGVQSKGVATSLKHYAANNQETYRMSIDAAVDDRALFDLYLKPFEIAVKKASPATVMASYNRVNGIYATENRRLLTQILRLEYGFTGAVLSDWGAVYNRAAGIAAGMDLEMPSSGGVNDYAIEQAVLNGTLPEDALDVACWNILKLVYRYTRQGKPNVECDFSKHHRLAVEALEQSAVLLKNEQLLPLQKEKSLAVIGEMAAKPRYQGGGSSLMNPMHLTSFLDAMETGGYPFEYATGYTGNETDDGLVQEAAELAANNDTVLLFLGLPDAYECEGYDREHLHLPENQLHLLDAIAEVNNKICVVLCCGSPVVTPWLDKIQALLCLHLGGEGLGEAAVALLYGQKNPSGKLAESWPLALEDTPCFSHFPMGPLQVTYEESVFVGYRHYDTHAVPVQFPFGYGLSYTKFRYDDLHLDSPYLTKEDSLTICFTVQNTGACAGTEIAQVYMAKKHSSLPQPAHELLAFSRVALLPGESRRVCIQVPYDACKRYCPARQYNAVESGYYEIQVGANCRDLSLQASFYAEGESFGDKQEDTSFHANYTGKISDNRPPTVGEYTDTTVLELMTGTFWGRFVKALARRISLLAMHFSTDPIANKKSVIQAADQLPFKNIVTNAFGIVSPAAAQALLELCNGQGSVFTFIKNLFKRQPYRKKRR